MSEPRARHVVLDLGSEDFYGLWEILWRLKEVCPNRGESDLLEEARSAIVQLVREGAVALYWRATAASEPVPIGADPGSVLAEIENWCEPRSTTDGGVWVAVE